MNHEKTPMNVSAKNKFVKISTIERGFKSFLPLFLLTAHIMILCFSESTGETSELSAAGFDSLSNKESKKSDTTNIRSKDSKTSFVLSAYTGLILGEAKEVGPSVAVGIDISNKFKFDIKVNTGFWGNGNRFLGGGVSFLYTIGKSSVVLPRIGAGIGYWEEDYKAEFPAHTWSDGVASEDGYTMLKLKSKYHAEAQFSLDIALKSVYITLINTEYFVGFNSLFMANTNDYFRILIGSGIGFVF